MARIRLIDALERLPAARPLLGDAAGGWHDARAARDAVARRAAVFAATPPTTVALSAGNSVEAVLSLLALMAAGHRVLLENPLQTAAEQKQTAAVFPAAAPLGARLVSGDDGPRLVSLAEGPPETPGVLIRTSGSTGQPKLVRLPLDGLWTNAGQMASRKGLTGDDRILCAIPVFHSNGLVASLLSGLWAGAGVWLSERLPAPQLLDVLPARGITMTSGVPTLWAQLVALGPASARAFRDVRLGSSGAAPLTAELARATEAHLGLRLLEGYGLSEATCGVCGTPPDDRRPGWVGPPLDGTTVELRAADGGVVGTGETGELWLRGPQRMEGYHGDEAATAAVLSRGWLRSGDLAVQSADGFVRIVGRLKQLIIRSGFNVVPREVEDALRASGLLADVCVVGLPHDIWGEEVAALAVPAGDAVPAQLLEQLKAHAAAVLSGYKRPTRWRLAVQVPQLPSGKPDLAAVRAGFGDGG